MRRLYPFLALTLALASAPVFARYFHASPATKPALPSRGPASATPAPTTAKTPFQVGIASWYGPWFQGRETTSGERFNMNALTAAHRFLPFGTRVRVTNLLNQRSVVLRINDRGPVPADRIIDLSYAAARVLRSCAAGLVPVRLDILPQAADPKALLSQLASADVPFPHLLGWSGWKSASKN